MRRYGKLFAVKRLILLPLSLGMGCSTPLPGDGNSSGNFNSNGNGNLNGNSNSNVNVNANDNTAPQPGKDAVLDFSLIDVNPASPRFNQDISPRDYLGEISAWYFGHAT